MGDVEHVVLVGAFYHEDIGGVVFAHRGTGETPGIPEDMVVYLTVVVPEDKAQLTADEYCDGWLDDGGPVVLSHGLN